MNDSLYEIHNANESLEWICYESCGMPQYWNLELDSAIFDYSRSKTNQPSFSLVNQSCKSPPVSVTHPTATSTPVASPVQPNINTSASSVDDLSTRSYSLDPAKKRNEVTVVIANCEGVTGKKASIENMLTSLQPDIFLAAETKLDSSVYDAEFLPPTYRDFPPARKDRKRGGGGVFIAVREGILAEHLTEFDTECEISWIKIQLQNKNYMIVGVFYRPSDSSLDALNQLHLSISKIRSSYPRAKIFLGGDFNLPGINWENYCHTPLAPKKAACELLLKTVDDFNLEQLNLQPTRKENILELLFTSCPETVVHCGTGPGISDHDHIVIARVNLRVIQNKKKSRTIHLFKKADWEKAKTLINLSKEQFFKNNPQEKTVDHNWTHLKSCILDVITKCVPSKKISGRHKIPWFTKKLKRLARKKQRAYNRAKKSKKDRDWTIFRSVRKKLQKSEKNAHYDYLKEIISEDGNKGLWRYLKSTRKDTCGVSTLIKDGVSGSEPAHKARMLNEQFSSVFTKEDTNSIPDLGPSPYPEMAEIKIGEAGVRKLLKDLNSNKACGSDKIPATLLKCCADEIAPMLTFIFQQSLDTSTVPEDWKIALITPVFKKGKRTNPENYRPVSLTSICCKINEHIIVSQTMNHLENNNILVDYQHGFRRRRSCESQLLITSHDLATILNKHSQADVAVLDFAKAFDKVPHQRLIRKLQFYNLEPKVVGWIQAFLSNRSQSVVVDGHTSTSAPVLSGVPQGTVLGPLLFLLFINDIATNVTSSIRLFADDCLLYRETNKKEECEILQQDLDKLVSWSKTWGMAFNVNKCNIVSITNMKKNKQRYSYQMDGQPIKSIENTPYLGVNINSKLQWQQHINNISSAANRMLGFLSRTMRRCPQNLKESTYKAMVRPKLEYCSSIWDPHQQKYVAKLEMVQRRAARFVRNVPHKYTAGPQPSATDMVNQLGWIPLKDRRHDTRITLLYKVTNNLIEVPLEYHPVPNNTRESRRVHKQQFVRLQAENDTFKYAFIPRTIVDWNKLPSSIVEAESLEDLKARLVSSHN